MIWDGLNSFKENIIVDRKSGKRYIHHRNFSLNKSAHLKRKKNGIGQKIFQNFFQKSNDKKE